MQSRHRWLLEVGMYNECRASHESGVRYGKCPMWVVLKNMKRIGSNMIRAISSYRD